MVLEHKGRLQMVGGMDRKMATCSRALGGDSVQGQGKAGVLGAERLPRGVGLARPGLWVWRGCQVRDSVHEHGAPGMPSSGEGSVGIPEE